MSRAELARAVGLTKTAVSNWEQGINEPSRDTYEKLADMAKGETALWFRNKARAVTEGSVALRFARSEICAGAGLFFDGPLDIADTLVIPRAFVPNPESTVCVRVRGESMRPTIPAGAVVGIDTSPGDLRSLDGCVVAVQSATEGAMLKRMLLFSGVWWFSSDNPEFAPFRISEEWRVAGVVSFCLGPVERSAAWRSVLDRAAQQSAGASGAF